MNPPPASITESKHSPPNPQWRQNNKRQKLNANSEEQLWTNDKFCLITPQLTIPVRKKIFMDGPKDVNIIFNYYKYFLRCIYYRLYFYLPSTKAGDKFLLTFAKNVYLHCYFLLTFECMPDLYLKESLDRCDNIFWWAPSTLIFSLLLFHLFCRCQCP